MTAVSPDLSAKRRAAANKRWDGHIPRRVRLDALGPEQRHLVLALIAAAKSANESNAPERAA